MKAVDHIFAAAATFSWHLLGLQLCNEISHQSPNLEQICASGANVKKADNNSLNYLTQM